MPKKPLKIGQLAKSTGITVRTLHHYDELGLVKPSKRSPGGYRLYTNADINRLRVVLFLRKLSFSLMEIKAMFSDPEFSFVGVVNAHITKLIEHVRGEHEVYQRLKSVAGFFAGRKNAPLDEVIDLLSRMSKG